MAYGRWNCIIISNIIVFIGGGLTLIDNPSYVLAGRFIYGFASGAFSVFCPKYLNEIAPIELTGPIGSMIQVTVTFGILVPFIIGVFFTDTTDHQADKQLILIIFLVPLILSVIQFLLMMTVFRYDTPIFMRHKRQGAKLRKFMRKIY